MIKLVPYMAFGFHSISSVTMSLLLPTEHYRRLHLRVWATARVQGSSRVRDQIRPAEQHPQHHARHPPLPRHRRLRPRVSNTVVVWTSVIGRMKGGGHYQILVHLWATADKRTMNKGILMREGMTWIFSFEHQVLCADYGVVVGNMNLMAAINGEGA
uniref:Uncharacterized protein n=1 Tax=Zea mays TaxID=4577 RepID=A0A804N9N3_MAIZE